MKDESKKIAKIDLNKNATYTVSDGELKEIPPLPDGFGKQIISWQDEKPIRFDISYSKKI